MKLITTIKNKNISNDRCRVEFETGYVIKNVPRGIGFWAVRIKNILILFIAQLLLAKHPVQISVVGGEDRTGEKNHRIRLKNLLAAAKLLKEIPLQDGIVLENDAAVDILVDDLLEHLHVAVENARHHTLFVRMDVIPLDDRLLVPGQTKNKNSTRESLRSYRK